jgi:hypothetical protein
MKKLTYEYVKEQIEKKGYKLLSKEYRNNRQKLEYICLNGHRHFITWTHWQQGGGCPYCVNLGRPYIEFIRSEFEKEGYRLLNERYINAHQKLEYICPKGHKHSINWNNWQQGQRCPYCTGNGKPSIEFIRSKFKKEGYRLLTTKYINCKQKLSYICPKGHKHNIRWNDWKTGYRCLYCAGKDKKTTDFVRSAFEERGYELLTKEYMNCEQKLYYICPNGHRYSITWAMWQRGQGCPRCIGIMSRGEIELRNFIKSLGIKVLSNDRNQIFNPETGRGLELDIFMPALNKAIEYNGEYWHSFKGAIERDKIKIKQCTKKGIELLVIKEGNWVSNKINCINKIKNFVGDNIIK